MYLKSLTLKGFKSFADKTQMVFDPGLNVVVGPNGSGKSNVSDSILWVLGEQSAKMLRGQAMEDVIFSGSSARGAVGLAEVTLVLDNTDHTLPVDFSEVAVTRRMYRSGESEYLINNAPARLRDVQDILHDSGLGKDTHSIISQGKLDAVLSSRPEERRSLIEEAADISKHRRRKERSLRKLASMDENLARAKVVSREITRQLKPLERQVDKAKRAHELNERLQELTVQLAVDDLRRLQESHGRLSAKDKEAEAAVELARYRCDEKSEELERLQAMLEQKGLFVGDLGEQRRRMQDVLARLGSDARVLDEKGRGMATRLQQMRGQLQTMESQRAEAAEEHERLAGELSDVRVKEEDLEERVDELQERSHKCARARRELEAEVNRISIQERNARADADRETLAYAKLEDQVGNSKVEDEMFADRLAQLAESIANSEAAMAERAQREKAARSDLEEARAEVARLSDAINARNVELQAAHRAEKDARAALSGAEATLQALSSVDAEVEKASPLAARLAGSAAGGDAVRCRLADLVVAEPEVEGLVEQLLGDDLAALVVADADAAGGLAEAASGLGDVKGSATVVALSCARADGASADGAPGEALLSKLQVADEARGLIEALLVDVRLVGDAAAAVLAHEQAPAFTYVAPGGAAVLPDGRLRLGEAASGEKGALERKRRIRALREELPGLEEALAVASEDVTRLESELAEGRDAHARAKGEAARLQGEMTSTAAERGRLESQHAAAVSERAQVQHRREAASQKTADAKRHIEEHRAAAREASDLAEELAYELAEKRDAHEDAARESGQANRALSDARLELAMATERRSSLESRERDLARRSEELAGRIAKDGAAVRELDVVRLRVAPLAERLEALRARAAEWDARLRDRASLAEADSESLKKTIGDAKRAAAEASAELERANAAANEAKVDLGRLEVQVEGAVNAIVATGAVLDEALTVPAPENRDAAEREAADLKRRLEGIGPVNEVAMDEYLRLKERADYIGEQVADLESARASLKKISAAIDRKMKNQFLLVFDKVNRNFSEIFSLLFPGGQAHIEMTDPENLSETGIEVVAQPRGKRIAKMMLMSGGEKSLTALALLFAVYKVRTVPFYVFDEVEAALDDSNLSKLLDAIEALKESTQLIVISHQRRTMEQADVLYGVSMQADGVSRVVSQRLDKATGKVVDA